MRTGDEEGRDAMALSITAYGSVHHRDADTAGPFERLFTAQYATVVAIASRILADVDEAEDVAQEVFVAFHRRHTPLQDGPEPYGPYAPAWLHAAAVHTALNTIRGKRRRARREEAEAAAHARLHGGADAALDPQRALEEGERRREVQAALARLPAKSASVLALRYSGLSYAEVAAALGVSVGQIGTLLRRAEAALRKELHHATPR